ncbi:MAG: DNA polymerase III subunit delta [Lachnospiraceae bacterium]|nr:DNA polymerase III subunit delta [Lachnospiraceae bacterium]
MKPGFNKKIIEEQIFKTDMRSIDQDIKTGKFSNIYFLFGLERYLIRQYTDKLVKALIGPDDEINLKYYSQVFPDMDELIDFLDTYPFFAARRVAVIEDSGIFKNQDEELSKYLPNLPKTSYVIFVENYKGKRDKYSEKKYEQTLMNKTNELYLTVSRLGRLVAFPRQSEAVISKWLVRRFDNADLKITRSAMDDLLQYVGNDMSMLYNESEKLICYRLGHKTIDVEDVKEICVKNIDNNVFDMVTAISFKDRRKALKLYYDLLELKESPMMILALIVREYNRILNLKSLQAEGAKNETIKKVTGFTDWLINKYTNLCNKCTYEYLKEVLQDCLDTEWAFKEGRINDIIGVEMLIIKYSV